MAGKIIADQIQSTTAGTIDTKYVVSGSVKSWSNINGAGGAFFDSFNTSSHSDNGSGDGTVNLTNSMLNSNYSIAGSVDLQYVNSAYSTRVLSTYGRTTSSYSEQAGYGNVSSIWLFEDRNRMSSLFGDLA